MEDSRSPREEGSEEVRQQTIYNELPVGVHQNLRLSAQPPQTATSESVRCLRSREASTTALVEGTFVMAINIWKSRKQLS